MKTPKEDAVKRLNYIEGHLRGIKKMVEEEAYCVDILKQTYAVQRAIEKFEQILLRDHLSHCVPDGIRERRQERGHDRTLAGKCPVEAPRLAQHGRPAECFEGERALAQVLIGERQERKRVDLLSHPPAVPRVWNHS